MFTISNGRDSISFEIEQTFFKSENQPYDEYFLRVWGQCDFLAFDKQVDATRHDIDAFFRRLKQCYDALAGVCDVPSLSYEEDFSIRLSFSPTGAVQVTATMRDNGMYANQCRLEFDTDQTFIAETLRGMRATFGF